MGEGKRAGLICQVKANESTAEHVLVPGFGFATQDSHIPLTSLLKLGAECVVLHGKQLKGTSDAFIFHLRNSQQKIDLRRNGLLINRN